MTLKTLAATLSSAALLGAAASASATVLVVTYTGTVNYGHDQTGLFGTPGADLTGDAYVARYTYDTSVGIRHNALPISDELYGGSVYGVASPVSATLTINGHVDPVANDYIGSAITLGGVYIEEEVRSSILTPTGYAFASIDNYAGVNQSSLDASVPLTSGVGGRGHFLKSVYDSIAGYATVYTYADFSNGTVEISAAPEPAAWALVLGGFGLLGGVLRSRRRLAAI